MRTLTLILIICLFTSMAQAQKELFASQYMHNRYTVNTAFAGSGEALSVFGAYRKQWAGINGSPGSQLITAHSPLKNENIAIGVEMFNQKYGVFSNTGFSASYTYRTHTSNNAWLGLSVNAGAGFASSGWNSIPVKETSDPSFSSKETFTVPLMGVGAAWYGSRFFSGVSVANLFSTNIYTDGKTAFKPGEIIATGGYLINATRQLQVQPSVLLRLNTQFGTIYDVSTTIMWNNLIWIGASYRSTDDVVGLLAVQATPQLMVSYSMDVNTGSIGSFNNGTHELSLKYFFGYRVKSSNPKFF
jgi:type IX secretion system PorP/SprF family membrane protein